MGKKLYIYGGITQGGGLDPLPPVEQYSVQSTHFAPIDIYETDDCLVIDVEIPGMSTDDISISIENNILIIEGVKRKDSSGGKRLHYLCMERTFGAFRRGIKIDLDIDDTSGLDASYSGGVLRVKIAKRAKKNKEKIFIPIKEG